MQRPLSRLFVATTLITLLTAGCGGGQSEEAREQAMEDAAAEQGIDADVELDDDGNVESLAIDQGMGAMQGQVGINLELPEGFPEDVPLYPGLSIHAANAMPQGHMVQASTEDDRQEVIDFFKERLTAEGWTEAESNEAGQMLQMRFTKGQRVTGITIMPGNPGHIVQISSMTLQ